MRLALMGMLMAVAVFCHNGAGDWFREYEVKTLAHTVKRGETIWQIAESYHHLEKKETLGEFVWRVDRQNGKPRFIQPGDVVFVRYNTIVNK